VYVHTPPPPAPWSARCGIGSGITLDASAEGEAAEWRAKQVFLQRAAEPFELIESLRLDTGRVHRLDGHLARLSRSARHFNWPWDEALKARIQQALLDTARANPQGVFKLRLLLNAQGQFTLQSSALSGPGASPALAHGLAAGSSPASPAGTAAVGLATQAIDTSARNPLEAAVSASPPSAWPQIVLASSPMPEADDFIRHKTTRRQAYAPFSPPAGMLDTMLFNAASQVTEFTIGNVAIRFRESTDWHTPPLSAGLLPGVMRASLIQQGHLRESPIAVSDLSRAEHIVLINSVRACVPVHLIMRNIEGKP
jgi:para-aminobenzoate synthetase / 4-amino-4-deoxychorismate lyase